MDQLTIIVAVLSAILFGWVGYFLGNFFPFGGKKLGGIQLVKTKPKKKTTENLLLKARTLFSEGGDDEEGHPNQSPSESNDSQSSEIQISSEEISHIWYDKIQRKIFAEIDGIRIDLDDSITPEQHSLLSFMLLDLQDKVGISAALRSVIEEREGEAFPQDVEEEMRGTTFNPIKTFVNYVQADVPKLEEKGDSIPSQINEILQRMLKDTQLESHGIAIGEWPDRGVVFIVGVDVYSDIHQIPDSDIRFVIREAVKEWESKDIED